MSRLDDMKRTALLQVVEAAVAEDPSLCREIIDAATMGVKIFADAQTNMASNAVCKLMTVMEKVDPETPGLFGEYFTAEQVMTCLERFFGGTKAMMALRDKFKCWKPEVKP